MRGVQEKEIYVNNSEIESDKENDELRLCLKIAQDEEKEVDYEVLDKKYPIIDWKTQNYGTKPQLDEAKTNKEINLNVVTRSNGQQRHFSVLTSVLSIFDREDLNAVYQLVMNKYQDEMPEGVVIHMLTEKKYPLKKEILVQMLNLKLESEEESTMALEFDKKYQRQKNWLVHKQTAWGKDFSNPLMVYNLPKIVSLSIPEQTATGKGTSNPLMAAEKARLLLKKDREYKSKHPNPYERSWLTIPYLATTDEFTCSYVLLKNLVYRVINLKLNSIARIKFLAPQTDQAEHIEEINQNVVIRSNGQKRYFSTLMRVLSIFDREDLNAVYQLVMDRFQDEIPEGLQRT
ncbi:hypothetical protein Tco_1370331 [Tanacetum coccineum]